MQKDKQPLWRTYTITWHIGGKLCGSVPKNQDLMESWLKSRRPTATPPNARSIPDIQAEVAASMLIDVENSDELERQSWLGFQSQGEGLVMRGATIRAHFKDCARVVNTMYVGKIEKEKTLQWKIVNGLYVQEYWVPIMRGAAPVRVADGYMDKAVHTMTRMGPINALKRIDFVSDVTLTFTLRLLCGVRLEDIETIMQYGGIHGYAGERSDGEGRYVYEIHDEASVTA